MKLLSLTAVAQPAEVATLHKLQGLNHEAIERLSEEGITSMDQLAYTDPVRLLLKTNLEQAFVVDIVDQALLYIYVGEKTPELRSLGIRGAIEMATLWDLLSRQDPTEIARGNRIADLVAQKLGQDVDAVKNLARNLWEDGQVDLVWNLVLPYEQW